MKDDIQKLKDIKIAVFAYHPVSYHVGFYRKMIDKGLNIKVIYCDRTGIEKVYDPEFNSDIPVDGTLLEGYPYVFLRNLAWNRSGGMYFFRRINPMLVSELKKYDVLFLHGFGTVSCMIAFLSAKVYGLKILWRGEATLIDYADLNTILRIIKTKIVSWLLKRCDAIFFSCSGNREYLLKHGVEPEKMFALPCAVDNDFLYTQYLNLRGRRRQIRSDIGLTDDDLVILMVGRLIPRKRPHDLLKAVSLLPSEIKKKVFILLCGDGPLREELEYIASKENIRIKITGIIPFYKLPEYYTAGDIFAILSSNDPSPKVLNESMNFALPVICSDAVGTSHDLVKDNENGFIVPVGDIYEISRRLYEFMRDPDKIKLFGEMSLRIIKEWNYDKEVEGVIKALNYVYSHRR